MTTENFENAVKAFKARDTEMESLRASLVQTYKQWSKRAHELAKLVVPTDMAEGETICVWVRTAFREERLLSVKLVKYVTKTVGSGIKDPVYEVMFRGKPREEPEDADDDRHTTPETEPEDDPKA